jgi:hypothetical protein
MCCCGPSDDVLVSAKRVRHCGACGGQQGRGAVRR